MISVIVPVYKSEKTLRRCVESLCRQTHKDLEILLIVDGPPDGSGILAEELSKEDTRIRVINQKNQGVSFARNRGIQEAKGEYIRFVDSDDFVDEDSNEKLFAAMEKTDADLVIGGFHHLYFNRDILKTPGAGVFQRKKESFVKRGTSLSADEDFRRLYFQGFFNMPWNKLYKKELIREGFPTELNLGEDLLFNFAYVKGIERITAISHPVCNYIQDDRGTTLSTKKRMDKIPIALRLFSETEAFFKELHMDDGNMPASKTVIQFLDDLEGLSFDASITKEEKLSAISTYKKALDELGEKGKKPVLGQLDYKIIFFFWRRNCFKTVRLLIDLRGLIVKILKKRG